MVTTTSMTAASPSMYCPTSTWNGPIVNQFTPLAYVPPPCTKCQRIRSDMTNAAPMATMP